MRLLQTYASSSNTFTDLSRTLFATCKPQNVVTAASQSATLLSMTVNLASEMHFNALRSLTQPCLTAYCVWCNTPMIQAPYQALQISVSLGKCTWDLIYQENIKKFWALPPWQCSMLLDIPKWRSLRKLYRNKNSEQSQAWDVSCLQVPIWCKCCDINDMRPNPWAHACATWHKTSRQKCSQHHQRVCVC